MSEEVEFMIKEFSEKKFDNMALITPKQFECFVKDKINNLRKNNPYPEDIFAEPTQREWNQIDKALKENGFTLDKISGSVGRRVWNNCLDDLEKELLDSENGYIEKGEETRSLQSSLELNAAGTTGDKGRPASRPLDTDGSSERSKGKGDDKDA